MGSPHNVLAAQWLPSTQSLAGLLDSGDAVSNMAAGYWVSEVSERSRPQSGGNSGIFNNQDQYSSSATSHCIHIVASKEWLP